MGVRKVKNMKESTHIVRCIAPLDETSLVLLDQTVNYLLQTRSKNFSIDFRSHGISENRSVAGTSNGSFPFLRSNEISDVF